MDLGNVGTVLSDETRRRLIEILRDSGPLTSKNAHEIFTERFADRRRESIYKALEVLVENGFAEKYYDQDGDGIVYDLCVERLLINFTDMTVVEEGDEKT